MDVSVSMGKNAVTFFLIQGLDVFSYFCLSLFPILPASSRRPIIESVFGIRLIHQSSLSYSLSHLLVVPDGLSPLSGPKSSQS